MVKSLTDKKFWKNYWESKQIVAKMPFKHVFYNLFKTNLKGRDYDSFIEIGGFPGYFCAYFKKYWNFDVTLLDYYLNEKQIEKLFKANDLKLSDVRLIKKDLFKVRTKKKFDVVFSMGFIEHFDDPLEAIERHWKLVNEGGTMILTIPNFLGINGLVQRFFDKKNLEVHNLLMMDIRNLNNKLKEAGIKKFRTFYYGGTGIWLEHLEARSIYLRATIYLFAGIGKIFNFLRINSKYLSPHIVVVAEK